MTMTTTELAQILTPLCPMHALLDPTGHIRSAGPTLQKLRAGQPLAGQRFLEVFELSRPRSVVTMQDLLQAAGTGLRLRFRDPPETVLKGVMVPLPEKGGAIVNLSFGISVLDAVRDYALTSADFATTELAIELLYLVEAKSAAMEASRKLNLRLQGLRVAAEEQAFTDTLTGLKNRRAMDHVVGRRMARRHPFALMHLDLDHFKSVNDQLGHAAGDHVLQQAATTMIAHTREEDMVARVGGDEFVLMFDGLLDRDHLEAIARRLIGDLERPIQFDGHPCRISASIGTALFNSGDDIEAAELLRRADEALYAAKRAGRGRHRFYDPKMDAVVARPAQAS